MRVHVLALDGVFDTGLSTVLDAFGTANELAAMTGRSSPPFDVRLVGLRRSVRTSQGLRVPVQAASGRKAPDLVIVPAIGHKMPEPLVRALSTPEVRDAGALLRDWSRGRSRIAAACIGTFVLAESTLLDGEDATTT
jgi:transcriptional regulator GlxA family with amidase domain